VRLKINKEWLRGINIDPRHMKRMVVEGFQSGWYFPGEENSLNRSKHLRYNYTANIIANLVGGSFLTGLLLLMNADDGFIGLISIFTFAANLLQLVAPLLLERFEKRKRILIAIRCVIHLFNVLFIGAIPFLPLQYQSKLFLVGAAVIVVNVLSALAAPGYTVWHIKFIPQNVRLRYFSLLTMTCGALVAVVNLLAGKLLDVFKAGGAELAGYTTLRAVALIIAVADIFLLCGMKEYPYEQDAQRIKLTDLLIKPFKETRYLMTVAIAFLWSFTANIPGSYYTVYLLRNLEISYSMIMLVSLINVPMLILFTPLWTKIFNRGSLLKTCALAMLAFAPHYFGLALTTRSTLAFYPIASAWGLFFQVGINLAMNNLPYINIPQNNQTVFIGFYSTMANLGALLGVVLGRQLVTAMDGSSNVIFGLADKQVMVGIVGILMVLTALAVYVLQKKIQQQK